MKAWRQIKNIMQYKGANPVIKFVTLDQWQSHYTWLLLKNQKEYTESDAIRNAAERNQVIIRDAAA
jgi:hypothetical protein